MFEIIDFLVRFVGLDFTNLIVYMLSHYEYIVMSFKNFKRRVHL
jgi:hypothetical protein